MSGAASIKDCHIAFASELVDAARHVLADFAGDPLSVEVKPDRSLVTQMDLMIETRLREMIAARFPHHGIIGEEQDWHRPGAEAVWVLDPIDGTAAFIAGMPVYGTLIALAIDGVPRLGVIDIPAIDVRWIGAEGRPTTRNGRSTRVRSCDDLSGAILTNSNQDYLSAAERPVLERLRRSTGTRVYGGASLNYGLLASGRTDIALDGGQKVFDFAPFRPVVEGAGGVVTDWEGRQLTLESEGTVLAAGDAAMHREVLNIIAEVVSGLPQAS